MGGKTSKPGDVSYKKMSKATKEMYYRAEFRALGDVVKDGLLTEKEFTRLMKLLFLPQAERRIPMMWKKQKKAAGDKMSEDEYVQLMFQPSVDSLTNQWRKMFAEFDTDGSGWVSRQGVEQKLEKDMPVNNDLKAKIAAMDSDHDERIHYGDFLRVQFQAYQPKD